MSEALTTRSPAESPYKLDSAQTLKASTALLKHMASERKARATQATKKDLLAAGSSDEEEGGANGEAGSEAEPIQLVITTKNHMVRDKSLKPRKIGVPHTMHVDAAVASICLITPDPQRRFKDVVEDAAFPKALADKIRILGIDKLKSRYKSYEQRRQLRDEHDVFLADDRIIPMLPSALGKIFFESAAKRPLPVSLGIRQKDTQGKTVKVTEKKINSNKRSRDEGSQKDVSVLKPEAFAREIEKTLSSVQVHLTPSVTTTIRVGYSTFSAQQLAENTEAVVQGTIEKHIARGWRNVRSINIKGPKTIALKIWEAPQLWEEGTKFIEDGYEKGAAAVEAPGQKKRAIEGAEEKSDKKSKKQKLLSQKADEEAREAAQQRQRFRQAKAEAKKAIAAGA